tara:strand:- start:3972 stop:4382 length:411 start_codon:yes stop_codon:yes gene_type:complete
MDKYYSDDNLIDDNLIDDNPDNFNSDSNIYDDIDSRETMKSMLIFILFISFCRPCMYLMKSFLIKCKDNYNVNKIPIIKIRSNDNLLLDSCSICLEKYKVNDKVMNLKCRHSFHKDCLNKWLKNNNTCPQCRENII